MYDYEFSRIIFKLVLARCPPVAGLESGFVFYYARPFITLRHSLRSACNFMVSEKLKLLNSRHICINKLQHRKCFVRILIHELPNFGKLTRSLRSLVRFPKFGNSWIKIRTSHFLWRNLYIPHKWIVLFARSDWFTRRWLASTIHLRVTGARDF